MPTIKLLTTAMMLNNELTEAVIKAIKGGMEQSDILAAVQRLAELVESGKEVARAGSLALERQEL